MRNERAQSVRRSGKATRRRLACVLGGLVALPGLAAAQDATPLVSPDRIEDVPSTRLDPFPSFDNFAWRAFIALNWPSLPGARNRGEPDRAKSLGDPGPRVWETFKSRYELFEVGPNGKPAPPSPWASFDGRNPCGDVDNRAKTHRFVRPLRGIQSARLHAGRVPQSARRAEPHLYALRDPGERARI